MNVHITVGFGVPHATRKGSSVNGRHARNQMLNWTIVLSDEPGDLAGPRHDPEYAELLEKAERMGKLPVEEFNKEFNSRVSPSTPPHLL